MDRLFCLIFCVLVTAFLSSPLQGRPSKSGRLTVYNWTNYIDKNVIIDFEARYKVRVNYKTYNSIAGLQAILKKLVFAPDAAVEDIDVIIMPVFLLKGLAEQNLLRPINAGSLINDRYIFKNLMFHLRKMSKSIGRTRLYGLPYLWGTSGLAYDVQALRQRNINFPKQSWSLIFNPKFAAQFSDCGIVLEDRPREVFQIIKNALGLDPHSIKKQDLTRADIVLRKLRPYIDIMSGFDAAHALAYGDACIALAQSQEVFLAKLEAQTIKEEMKQNRQRTKKRRFTQIKYVFPKAGSLLWMDVMVIPVQTRKWRLAYKWIDYILDAENSSKIAQVTGFATPSARALKLLPSKVRKSSILYPSLSNKNIFLDQELLDHNDLPDPSLSEEEDRIWERFINSNKR